MQAVCSPFTGLLGDRLNRAWLIGVGALIWGVMTAGIGASKTLSQAMGFAAANGIGLAILIPCAQSLLADYYHPSSRGIAFGLMYCISSLGAPYFQPPIGSDNREKRERERQREGEREGRERYRETGWLRGGHPHPLRPKPAG